MNETNKHVASTKTHDTVYGLLGLSDALLRADYEMLLIQRYIRASTECLLSLGLISDFHIDLRESSGMWAAVTLTMLDGLQLYIHSPELQYITGRILVVLAESITLTAARRLVEVLLHYVRMRTPLSAYATDNDFAMQFYSYNASLRRHGLTFDHTYLA